MARTPEHREQAALRRLFRAALFHFPAIQPCAFARISEIAAASMHGPGPVWRSSLLGDPTRPTRDSAVDSRDAFR